MKKYTELNLINLLLKKNNKKGIKGDKRIYYSCCLCCETEESLEQIKYEKEELEKKLNELIEPEDIIFENLEGSLNSKINNIFCVSFVSVIIVGISLVINGLLFYFQSSIDKSEDPNGKTFIIYVLSFLISIANSIIDFIIEIVLEKLIKS